MVMQHVTHKSAIAILRDHVVAWRMENQWSREMVADLIVQAHERIGADKLTGIRFEPPTTDQYERFRVNADRVFRWLDDTSKDRNILTLNMLWSVLAAFPMDRRIRCLNDLLQPIDITVRGIVECDGEVTQAEINAHFQDLVDHAGHATIATAALLDGIHSGEAEHAEAKLGLAAATIQRARLLVGRIIKRRKS